MQMDLFDVQEGAVENRTETEKPKRTVNRVQKDNSGQLLFLTEPEVHIKHFAWCSFHDSEGLPVENASFWTEYNKEIDGDYERVITALTTICETLMDLSLISEAQVSSFDERFAKHLYKEGVVVKRYPPSLLTKKELADALG